MARGYDPFGSHGVRTEAPVPSIDAFSSIKPQCVPLKNAMAAEPAAGPALNSPESPSRSRLYRRNGAEDLRTSPHPDEDEPRTGWDGFCERAGQAFGSKRRNDVDGEGVSDRRRIVRHDHVCAGSEGRSRPGWQGSRLRLAADRRCISRGSDRLIKDESKKSPIVSAFNSPLLQLSPRE